MLERIALIAVLCLPVPPACGDHAAAGPLGEKLNDLKTKQIIVPMWGWPPEEMAEAAVNFGFQAVNAPHGNDIEAKAEEVKAWARCGLKMIARPSVPVRDPFDPDGVRRGCEELNRVIRHYDSNPDVVGFSLAWGLYGEGGFPPDFVFSDRAIAAFNHAMGTPGLPLPEPPAEGVPGSLRWVRWLEFRSRVLRDFRETFIKSARTATGKLVGTWSEFYPIENYQLNMGEAPGADFLMYDLSFGDATTDQTRAFGECHGDMQHKQTYEEWLNHELPLMARAAGEGVTPVAFQFPMRRGHATDFLTKTTVFIDRIEDEYSLRSGPEIRKLIDAARSGLRAPEVALVYQSFAAAALPGGSAFWFYQPSARGIEAMLSQMGVYLKVIPYEHIESADLTPYRLVIVPDPMYLSDGMRANLAKARRVLYSGEYLLTHHDPATATGDYSTGWRARANWELGELEYGPMPGGPLRLTPHRLTRGIRIPPDKIYPADQAFAFNPLPVGAEVIARVGRLPAIVAREGGRVVHVCNRLFNHFYHQDDGWLESVAFEFLRNLALDSGVTLRVEGPQLARAKEGIPFGSYGLTGRIAWNKTGREIVLNLSDGQRVSIPPYGWTAVSVTPSLRSCP